MASPRSARRALLVIATAVCTATAVLPVSTSQAEPTRSLEDVQQAVEALNAKADVAVEQYAQAKIRLSEASRRTAAAERKLAAERKAIEGQRQVMGQVATAAYRSGGMDQIVTLVTSADPQAFLDRASSLDQVSTRQASALRALQAARLYLAQAEDEAQQRLAEQEKVAAELKAQKAAIEANLAEQERLLASLEAEERERLEAQRAAQQRAAAATAAPKSAPRPAYNGPASGRAAIAVQFAYDQLGKPYQWGGAGPNSYDCSGLTMAAWARAGVSLPHSSQAQYSSGPHVDRANLQPGDLVFYGSPIHHVSLYIGDGKTIDAPHSGAYVRIGEAFRSDYVGAVRP